MKRADPAGADALAVEADRLRALRHPGVVQLVSFHTDRDGAVLVQRFAGSRTLATWRPTAPTEVAGVIAALAETLGELHLHGWAHNRVGADHVVLDGEGRPRLCGVAQATEAAVVGPGGRHDDVAAVGALLHELTDRLATDLRSRLTGRPRRRDARALRSLQALAAEAQDPDERARPSARRLAAAILRAVPDASLPAIDDPSGDLPGRSTLAPPDRDAPERGQPHVEAPGPLPRATATTAPPRLFDTPALFELPDEADEPDRAEGAHASTVHIDPPLDTPDEADAAGLDGAATPTADRDERATTAPRPPVSGDLDVARARLDRADARRRRRRRGARLASALLGSILLVVGVSTFGHGEAPTLSPESITSAAAADDLAPPTRSPSSAVQDSSEPPRPAAAADRGPTGPTGTATTPGAADATTGAPTAGTSTVAVPSPLDSTAGPDPPAGEPCPPERRCSTIWRDGVVERDGRRYAIGEPGDEIVLTDQACGEPAVPVVLRPTTGEVFRFDGWADEEHEAVAPLLARAEPGSHLVPATADDDGCTDVLARRPDGSITTLLDRPGPQPPAPTSPPRPG